MYLYCTVVVDTVRLGIINIPRMHFYVLLLSIPMQGEYINLFEILAFFYSYVYNYRHI